MGKTAMTQTASRFIDPVEKHIRQARKASGSQPEHPILSCTLGDARNLAIEAMVEEWQQVR